MSMYNTAWNDQNAAARMKSAATSGRTASAKLQEGFEFAYNYAKENGNLQFITAFLEACIEGRFRANLARKYVAEAISNIRYQNLGKAKDGTVKKGYKKANKDEPITFNGLPDRNWYDSPKKAEQEPLTREELEARFRTTMLRAATRFANEAGVSPAEIADVMAHVSAELQSGDIEIKLKAA